MQEHDLQILCLVAISICLYSTIDVVNTPCSCFKNLIHLAVITILPCAAVIAKPRTNKELF